jgi:hypothetical protein
MMKTFAATTRTQQNRLAAIGRRNALFDDQGLRGPPYFVAHFVAREKHRKYKYLKSWSEWQDSNLRPLRPERSALPG